MSVELTQEEYPRFRKRQNWKEAEQDKADEQLAAAVRKYLFETVRISGDAQWEHDPDFALLAVARVVLEQVCYQNLEPGTDEYELVSASAAELTAELEDMGCQKNDGPWGETPDVK